MLGTRGAPYAKLSIPLLVCLLLLQPRACFSLIFVGRGSGPVHDAGWPLGALKMANLRTRVGWWEGPPLGGGRRQFLYRCQKTEEFNEALKTFAAIRAPRLEVVLHDGPSYNDFLRKTGKDPKQSAETRFDWSFTVWNPEAWHRLYNDPKFLLMSGAAEFRQPVAPPTLDVYIGGGAIVWREVRIPGKLVVIDKRAASAPVKPVGGGLVRGDVYDMSTGKPIAGAEIILSIPAEGGGWKEVMRGRSDAVGAFRIEKIPAGHYVIAIRAEGYAPRGGWRYENAGNSFHELLAELARSSSIKGVVTDLEGRPISQAKVSAEDLLGIDGRGYQLAGSQATTSDDQGRFEISPLPIGFTRLRCQAPSLHLTNSIFEIYPIPSESIKLVMEGTGVLRVKVVDKNGNIPAGEVHIRVQPVGEQLGKWGGDANCGKDGRYQFTGVPPGRYLVSANPELLIEGRDPNTKEVSIEAGQAVEVEVVRADR